MRKAVIQSWAPEAGRRILVVSDIHGNVPYFEGVLRKVGFSDRDELVIDGGAFWKKAKRVSGCCAS